MEHYETALDRAIREAAERGEFDNLPGSGKPLPIRHSGDPDWWLKQARRARADLARPHRVAAP